MDKRIVHTDAAPAAIGPYSQAVVSGDLVFTSGQVALHPGTGELVGATAVEQAEQAFANLDAVLTAAGATRASVLKCVVFLKDMGEFAAVNEVYARFFEGTEPPARSCVEAARLPKDALFEIEAVARIV